MKKYLGILITSLMFFGLSFAQQSNTSFLVEVSPSTFQQNQPVDVTITVMKDGQVDTQYTGDVYLSIDGLQKSEYVLPSHARYTFSLEDMGKKTLSKGLEIKKSGTFTLKAASLSEDIVGSTQINVQDTSVQSTKKTIAILSPLPNSAETDKSILLLASSPDLPNGLAQIYLNNQLIDQISFDQGGQLSKIINSGMQEGVNTLQIIVESYLKELLGESEIISFTYAPFQDDLFKNISITPSTGLRLGDRILFEVQTNDLVASVTLLLSNGQKVPVDKSRDGFFTKNLMLINTGTIDVSLEIIAMGETKTYTGIASLFVDDAPMVENVQFTVGQNPTELKLSRGLVGTGVSLYLVQYGTEEESLGSGSETSQQEIIFEGIDTTQTYFFQITPLLGEAKDHGASTDIYKYIPPVQVQTGTNLPLTGGIITGNVIIDIPEAIPTCVIKGIRVTTEKIGDKYYLVWNEIPNATSYSIYRAETFDVDSKSLVLTTTETRYEYPFDHAAEEDQYAYFRVEATCADGQVMEITSAKKIQVGPMDDILLLICVSLLIYGGIRLYRYAE
ncbi:MAG: hypothetical protein PHU61_02675 [Candidatus Absconditabacteria bacterium]|nr:hypothetical protein [Candidatus Absconditabacteria bacterium]MDD3868124.1 hypothetical protein [Candidatus Absconditabacteria bacterium]MDD4714510.1 hypothetical protein [Candidatus Absconditabacteria bacterium]